MTERAANEPFLLEPAGKDYLWGGERLKTEYGKKLPLAPLAETWECSTHPDGLCFAASGTFCGFTLKEVLERHPEYLGTHPLCRDGLPVLVKFIDARENLSVQVHPDDDYALKNENGSLGKTEMWYILEPPADRNKPGIVYGFRRPVTKPEIRAALEKGKVETLLQRVKISRGDVFLVRAGTVHAVMAGTLLAEVQESSNITYRFYDYDRKGPDGKKRPLHIEKALEVTDLSEAPAPRQPMRVLKYRNGCAQELLARCRHFQTERILLNAQEEMPPVVFRAAANSFEIFLCTDGAGEVRFPHSAEDVGQASPFNSISFRKGSCLFVPADSVSVRFLGKGEFLRVQC